MNKNILLSIAASLVLLATFTSCDEERTLYAGPEYIMFADTLTVLGVENSDEVEHHFGVVVYGEVLGDTLHAEVTYHLACLDSDGV